MLQTVHSKADARTVDLCISLSKGMIHSIDFVRNAESRKELKKNKTY